jgi:hypothetical protein
MCIISSDKYASAGAPAVEADLDDQLADANAALAAAGVDDDK